MRFRILCIISFFLMANNYIFSQWIQTDGPYGTINVSAIIRHDSFIFVAGTCGFFSSDNIRSRWNIKAPITFSTNAMSGDSLFYGGSYNGINMIDLSRTEINPVPLGLDYLYINTISGSDSCLYAGALTGGFNKSVGFSDQWQQYNNGLPTDTGYIPPKFGGGTYLIRNVYSIANNSQFIFAGTQRGIFRADPDDLVWESKNAGLPLNKVSLIFISDNDIYICIEDTIYRSNDNGESWKDLFVSQSEITSINVIDDVLFTTMRSAGIYRSEDDGITWKPFNNGLNDLQVNIIEKTDTTLVCGTCSGGFYYFEQGMWKQNNTGIICSSVRSITTTSDAVIANDNDDVYILDNGNKWSIISPDVPKSYFGSLASMGDTVFLSVDYTTSSYPFDQPFIVYSADRGNTWKNLINPVPFVRDDAYGIYCDDNRLYAFEDEIMYYTDDLGSTWHQIILPFNYCNQFVDFLVYHSIPFAAACGNGEFIKLDTNEDWILSNTGLPVDRPLNGLAYCDDAIYTYVDVYGMYISMDDGNTWNQCTNGFNLQYGYGIHSFAESGHDLFITTVNGVYYTGNDGGKWDLINSGLINKSVSDIVVFDDTLYVGTYDLGYFGKYGDGIWKCAIKDIPVSVPDIISRKTAIHIFPNPAKDYIQISDPASNGSVLISVTDLSGRTIFTKVLINNELNVSDLKEGAYIISIISDELSGSDILIIDR